MYPKSVLDLLYKPSYWPKIVSSGNDYDKYVAALTALASYGAYEAGQGELLKSLLVQRLSLPADVVSVESISISAPALFVDTNAYVVRIPIDVADASRGSVVILVFRGTEFVGSNFLVDVFTDARAVPVQFPAAAERSAADAGTLLSGFERIRADAVEALARFGLFSPRHLDTDGKSYVHGGFLTAADLVWSKLIDELALPPSEPSAQLGASTAGNGGSHPLGGDGRSSMGLHGLSRLRSNDRLYITGHSLGAAVAVLAAARLLYPPIALKPQLENIKSQLRGVYTFGQPMIGGERFKAVAESELAERTFRHVYRDDWVPHLPPVTTGLYTHFGKEYRARSSTTRFVETPEKTGQALSAIGSGVIAALPFMFKAIRVLNAIGFKYSVEDHQPENYWRSCEAALDAVTVEKGAQPDSRNRMDRPSPEQPRA